MKILQSLFYVALLILQMLFGGLVLSKLWRWFVVTKFAAPQLNYLDCVGLIITANFVLMPVILQQSEISQKVGNVTDLSSGIIRSLVIIVAVYPIALAVGFFWHLFV